MADELALRVEGTERAGTDGRMRDASGVSKTTLQKAIAGERMPPRPVVQHLLDIAADSLPDPPSAESQKALWDSYYPALYQKLPLLADLYKAIDARDEALSALAAAQERERQLRAELERQGLQERVVRTGLERVRADIERAEEVALERVIRGPKHRFDYAERLRALSRTSQALGQQLTALSDELEELREQNRRAVWRALRAIRRAQRKRERELIAEVEALRAERDELQWLLTRARVEAEETRYQVRQQHPNELTHDLLTPSGQQLDAVEELEQWEEEMSWDWERHGRDRLTRSYEEVEAARAEVRRRDTHLAQLLEGHSNRIARLRESSVLTEADEVLATALKQLSDN
ncbi:hypothetical protein ACFUV2_28150 [Streptomyces pilosus]|uniref:hypothetical protein n=1 Tax=Streptomyces pilosus TaxID=28893 RepID=UPI003628095C